jgi:chromosomal replication initiator protein
MNNLDEAWDSILSEFKSELNSALYVTWFKNTSIGSLDGQNLELIVPNIFCKNHLLKRYRDDLAQKFEAKGFHNLNFEVIIKSSKKDLKRTTKNQSTDAINLKQIVDNKFYQSAQNSGLNPKYNFDNFIVGGNNDLAFAACQAVVKDPGTKFNPLFIYGGVGLGKTHLIQAVGNEALKINSNLKVVYASSEQFVNEFLDSIRTKKKDFFTNKYRKVDVLIIDDIQFIAGKEKTQEEFFHVFNQLHQANKQIIISSDQPPRSIPTIEERLRSRFEWGMTADIQSPDYETRCAIIMSKAIQNGVKLKPDIVEFIAESINSNVRELEGSVNRFLVMCQMKKIEPDLEAAKDHIIISHSKSKYVSAQHIIEKTARYFDVSMDDIKSPRRDKVVAMPRQVAMYLMRTELNISFPKIAEELGRKDHTTAMHSVGKIKKEILKNNMVRQYVQEVKEIIYG